jgi:hypothetical protein
MTINEQLVATQTRLEQVQHQLLVKRFFPSYIRKVGATINRIGKYRPKLACKLTMGMLSVSLRKPLKAADYRFYQDGKPELYRWKKHRFYTYSYGEGTPILLLHGWCSNGARWREYVQELVAAGYRAIVLDAPGHGLSPGRFLSVPDYIQCVREVLLTEPDWHAIIAHSMGSLTGIIGASEAGHINPSTRLVLMSTFSNCDRLMSTFARCLGVSEEVLQQTREWITEYTGRPLSYFSLTDHLQALGNDRLLIADTEDIVVPQRELETILQHYPNIEYQLTEGLGHNLYCPKLRRSILEYVLR